MRTGGTVALCVTVGIGILNVHHVGIVTALYLLCACQVLNGRLEHNHAGAGFFDVVDYFCFVNTDAGVFLFGGQILFQMSFRYTGQFDTV